MSLRKLIRASYNIFATLQLNNKHFKKDQSICEMKESNISYHYV